MSRHLIVKPLATPVDKLGQPFMPCIDVCAIDRLDTTVVDEGIVRKYKEFTRIGDSWVLLISRLSEGYRNLVHGAKTSLKCKIPCC
jgi:hypothetical protein